MNRLQATHCPQPVFQSVPGSLSFLESGGKWLTDKGWRFKQSVLWSSISLSLPCVEIFKEGRQMRRFPNYLTAETAPAGMPLEWDCRPAAQNWECCFCTSLLALLRRSQKTAPNPFSAIHPSSGYFYRGVTSCGGPKPTDR